MLVEVVWRRANGEKWDRNRVLYAYVHDGELLYIGKCWGETSSVWKRWTAADKESLRFTYKDVFGRRMPDILVGEIRLEDGHRKRSQLLSDVESLLIYELDPIMNRHCTKSRTPRRDMIVVCSGVLWKWDNEFVDAA